jgi:hypothetical protein
MEWWAKQTALSSGSWCSDGSRWQMQISTTCHGVFVGGCWCHRELNSKGEQVWVWVTHFTQRGSGRRWGTRDLEEDAWGKSISGRGDRDSEGSVFSPVKWANNWTWLRTQEAMYATLRRFLVKKTWIQYLVLASILFPKAHLFSS